MPIPDSCGGVLKVGGPLADLNRFVEVAAGGLDALAPGDVADFSWSHMTHAIRDGAACFVFNTRATCLPRRFFEQLVATWASLNFAYTGFSREGSTFCRTLNGQVISFNDHESGDDGESSDSDENGNSEEDEDAADSEDQGSDDPLEY